MSHPLERYAAVHSQPNVLSRTCIHSNGWEVKPQQDLGVAGVWLRKLLFSMIAADAHCFFPRQGSWLVLFSRTSLPDKPGELSDFLPILPLLPWSVVIRSSSIGSFACFVWEQGIDKCLRIERLQVINPLSHPNELDG